MTFLQKKSILLATILLLVFSLLSIPKIAISKTLKNSSITTLKEIRHLVEDITLDLEDETVVSISSKSGDEKDKNLCYCACRDNTWSCTTIECSLQGEECSQDMLKEGK